MQNVAHLAETTANFIAAMGAAATGVTVITTEGMAGRFGLTVSSMTSISLEPATVMVSIRNQSPSLAAILENGGFAVNILSAHQHEVSDVFAGRPRSGERFDFGCARFDAGDRGFPVLDNAMAALECAVWRVEEIHDHTLIFGLVEACYDDTIGGSDARVNAPLTYCQGRYGCPQPLVPA